MGSAASRAKKVAPALVTEHNRHLEGGREDLRRTRQDCRSQGRESDAVSDAESLEDDVERILEECESSDGGLNKSLFQTAFFSAKTCGLCYGRRGQQGSDPITGNTRVTQGEGVRRGHHSFEKDICPIPLTGDPARADPVITKAASAPGICDPSLALPVFYDASEEDLMNMIEREFG